MPLSEFELIRQFFTHSGVERPDVTLGVGDDCALLKVPAGRELAVSIDTLVEGVHFHQGIDPASLGHKSLAVSLSDLAAMGAEPAWVTMALTLPEVKPGWLAAFSGGFADLAVTHGVQLVGGDITRGPLTISVQAHGFLEPGQALRRDGAQAGDLIYVTGTLGDAGLALRATEDMFVPAESLPYLRARLDRPSPRLAEGRALSGLASAAIDISDGLLSDLGHICTASGLGATLNMDRLPCSPAVLTCVQESGDWTLPLAAGDDYELCVTVPPGLQDEMRRRVADFSCGFTRVGMIEEQSGIRCVHDDGRRVKQLPRGYEHFRNE